MFYTVTHRVPIGGDDPLNETNNRIGSYLSKHYIPGSFEVHNVAGSHEITLRFNVDNLQISTIPSPGMFFLTGEFPPAVRLLANKPISSVSLTGSNRFVVNNTVVSSQYVTMENNRTIRIALTGDNPLIGQTNGLNTLQCSGSIISTDGTEYKGLSWHAYAVTGGVSNRIGEPYFYDSRNNRIRVKRITVRRNIPISEALKTIMRADNINVIDYKFIEKHRQSPTAGWIYLLYEPLSSFDVESIDPARDSIISNVIPDFIIRLSKEIPDHLSSTIHSRLSISDTGDAIYSTGRTTQLLGNNRTFKITFDPAFLTDGFHFVRFDPIGLYARDGDIFRGRDTIYSSLYKKKPDPPSTSGGASSGAPTAATYVVVSAHPTLTDERVLVPGTGMGIYDAGAGNDISINVNTELLSGTYVGITTTGVFARSNRAYLTIPQEADLPSSRYFATGVGVTFVDGGAGSFFVIGIDTGKLNSLYSITGHSHILDALTDVTLTSPVAGQVLMFTGGEWQNAYPPSGTSSAAPDEPYVTIGNTTDLSAERALIAGTGIGIFDAGANSTVSVNVNTTLLSGTYVGITTTGVFTRSNRPIVTAVADTTELPNSRTLTQGTYVTVLDNLGTNTITVDINTGALGPVYAISGHTHTGGTNAPIGAQYITLATDTVLTNERVLTSGTAISWADGGAGGNLTVKVDTDALSGYFVGLNTPAVLAVIDGDQSQSRVLAGSTYITIADGGPGGNINIGLDTGNLGPVYALSGHTHILNDLRDVETGGAVSGNVLTYIGTGWIPTQPSHTGLSDVTIGDPHTQYTYVSPSTASRNTIAPIGDVPGLTIKPYSEGVGNSLEIFDAGAVLQAYANINGKLFGLGLDARDQQITNVLTPTALDDAATKGYVDTGLTFNDPSGFYLTPSTNITGHIQELGYLLSGRRKYWNDAFDIRSWDGGSFQYTNAGNIDHYGVRVAPSATQTVGLRDFEIPPWHDPAGGIGIIVSWFHTGVAPVGDNPTGQTWGLRVRFRNNTPNQDTGFGAYTTYNWGIIADKDSAPRYWPMATGRVFAYDPPVSGTHIGITIHRTGQAVNEFQGNAYIYGIKVYSPTVRYG